MKLIVCGALLALNVSKVASSNSSLAQRLPSPVSGPRKLTRAESTHSLYGDVWEQWQNASESSLHPTQEESLVRPEPCAQQDGTDDYNAMYPRRKNSGAKATPADTAPASENG